MIKPGVCPICQKRRPERYCPAKGETICAVCCGTEREVTLDCPADCSYLIAAHRYEGEHQKPLAQSEVPFPAIEFSSKLIYEHEPVMSRLGYAILRFAAERRELTDLHILTAVSALAETYRTLSSGIYYENPPADSIANGLYVALANCAQDSKKQESERPGATALKDVEIFYLLVFLARMVRVRTNGRPRARIFLGFLGTQFPSAEEIAPEPSRIILP